MLEERLLQCCVHVGTARDAGDGAGDDGVAHQCAPFCAVQAWPALSAMKLAETQRRLEAAPQTLSERLVPHA